MKWLFPAACGGLILAVAVSIPRAQDTAVEKAPAKEAAGTDKADPTSSKEAAPDSPAIEPRSADQTNTVRDPQTRLPTTDRSDAKPADVAKEAPKADDPDDEFKIIRLLRASPDSIRKAIIQIYPDEFSNGKLNVMADLRTNSVLLRARRGISTKVQELIITLDDIETTARDTASNPEAGEKPEESSGRAPPREHFAQAYRQHEDQAARLAAAYRRQLAATPADRGKLERLATELQTEVSALFEARQELQRADMNRLRGRLAQIERQIDARQQRAQEIVNNRIEELLHPEKQWEAGDYAADPATDSRGPDRDYPRRGAGGERPVSEEPRSASSAAAHRDDDSRGKESSISFVDRPSMSLREGASNPRKALLDAESAIATARVSAAQAEKGLTQARATAQRISELFKQAVIPHKEVFSSEAELAAQEARRARALIDLEQAERQAALAREDLAVQVELLKFDLDAAALDVEQASREEAQIRSLVSQNVISVQEADLKSFALKQARLKFQRAKTLHDLYRKALPDSGSTGDKKTTDGKSTTKSDDPFAAGKKE